MVYFNQTPKNAFQKAQKFEALGKHENAYDSIENFWLKNKKHLGRLGGWNHDHEHLMKKYVGLSIKLKKSPRDVLTVYRQICKRSNITSSASLTLPKESEDSENTKSIKPVEDLASQTFHTIISFMLDEVAQASKNEIDRLMKQARQQVLSIDDLQDNEQLELLIKEKFNELQYNSPILMFEQNCYKDTLELLRWNLHSLTFYSDVVKRACTFCLQLKRTQEFSRLQDLQTQHLRGILNNYQAHLRQLSLSQNQQQQFSNAALQIWQSPNYIDLNRFKNLQIYIDNRILMLETSIGLDSFSLTFAIIEDVQNLLNLHQNSYSALQIPINSDLNTTQSGNIDPKSLSNFYKLLSIIFLNSNNMLFHCQSLLKWFEYGLKSNLDKNILQKIYHNLILASLSLPSHFSKKTQSLEEEEFERIRLIQQLTYSKNQGNNNAANPYLSTFSLANILDNKFSNNIGSSGRIASIVDRIDWMADSGSLLCQFAARKMLGQNAFSDDVSFIKNTKKSSNVLDKNAIFQQLRFLTIEYKIWVQKQFNSSNENGDFEDSNKQICLLNQFQKSFEQSEVLTKFNPFGQCQKIWPKIVELTNSDNKNKNSEKNLEFVLDPLKYRQFLLEGLLTKLVSRLSQMYENISFKSFQKQFLCDSLLFDDKIESILIESMHKGNLAPSLIIIDHGDNVIRFNQQCFFNNERSQFLSISNEQNTFNLRSLSFVAAKLETLVTETIMPLHNGKKKHFQNLENMRSENFDCIRQGLPTERNKMFSKLQLIEKRQRDAYQSKIDFEQKENEKRRQDQIKRDELERERLRKLNERRERERVEREANARRERLKKKQLDDIARSEHELKQKSVRWNDVADISIINTTKKNVNSSQQKSVSSNSHIAKNSLVKTTLNKETQLDSSQKKHGEISKVKILHDILSKGTDSQMDVNELAKIKKEADEEREADLLRSLSKEKRNYDYFVRACRKEELPYLQKLHEEQREEYVEKCMKEQEIFLEKHKQKHENLILMKTKLNELSDYVEDYYNNVVKDFKEKENEQLEKKRKQEEEREIYHEKIRLEEERQQKLQNEILKKQKQQEIEEQVNAKEQFERVKQKQIGIFGESVGKPANFDASNLLLQNSENSVNENINEEEKQQVVEQTASSASKFEQNPVKNRFKINVDKKQPSSLVISKNKFSVLDFDKSEEDKDNKGNLIDSTNDTSKFASDISRVSLEKISKNKIEQELEVSKPSAKNIYRPKRYTQVQKDSKTTKSNLYVPPSKRSVAGNTTLNQKQSVTEAPQEKSQKYIPPNARKDYKSNMQQKKTSYETSKNLYQPSKKFGSNIGDTGLNTFDNKNNLFPDMKKSRFSQKQENSENKLNTLSRFGKKASFSSNQNINSESFREKNGVDLDNSAIEAKLCAQKQNGEQKEQWKN